MSNNSRKAKANQVAARSAAQLFSVVSAAKAAGMCFIFAPPANQAPDFSVDYTRAQVLGVFRAAY